MGADLTQPRFRVDGQLVQSVEALVVAVQPQHGDAVAGAGGLDAVEIVVAAAAWGPEAEVAELHHHFDAAHACGDDQRGGPAGVAVPVPCDHHRAWARLLENGGHRFRIGAGSRA